MHATIWHLVLLCRSSARAWSGFRLNHNQTWSHRTDKSVHLGIEKKALNHVTTSRISKRRTFPAQIRIKAFLPVSFMPNASLDTFRHVKVWINTSKILSKGGRGVTRTRGPLFEVYTDDNVGLRLNWWRHRPVNTSKGGFLFDEKHQRLNMYLPSTFGTLLYFLSLWTKKATQSIK